ncbi:MAG: VCBS repeat-containing protein [Deltaproteobacteria bacterium]|nr:VCBS repeat-containing protein [Deltaproteobacteria bacterium]
MTRSVRSWVALSALTLLHALSSPAQPAFEARTDSPGEGLGNPVSLAVGDFVNTGDGLLDLAVTWDREDALGIFENNGDGTFSLAVRRDPPPPPGMGGPPEGESNIGGNPGAVVAIDLDGDGIRDDLAGVVQEPNRFFAYENGGGTWLPSDPEAGRGGGISATVGHWGSAVFPADTCDDFFSATQNGAVNVAVSRCDGTGEFEIVARFFRSDEVSVQTDIEVGDFVELGADVGQVDVLTLDNLNQNLVIWPGDPTLDINLLVGDPMVSPSTLVFKPVMVAGQPASPVQSIAEDWDADGWLDLLVLVEEGHVLWFRGTGDPAMGGFEDAVVIDLALPLSSGTRQPTRLTAMAYEDVVGADGASAPDGIRDLVVADAGHASGSEEGFNWLWIVPGTGVGAGPPTFDTAAQYHFAAPNLGVLKPGSVAAADFNGGGAAPSIALLGFDSSAYTIFANDGAGGFNAARSYAAGATLTRGLAARRLAGEPADLVFASRGLEGIGVSDGDGTARLLEPGLLEETAALTLVDELKLLNLDGDSIPDALVTFRDEHVLYRGVPGGGYAAPEVMADGPLRLTGVSRAGNLGAGVADAIDFAIFDPALGNTTLGIWLGNGDGTFDLDQEVDGINRYSSAHAVGNFVAGSSLDAIVVAGDVAPSPMAPQLYVVTADAGGNYSVTATIGFPFPFDIFPSPVKLLVAADFTGNGFDDLVAVLGGGESFLFASNGTELLPPPAEFTVGRSPRVGIAEDVDGDGLPELVVANKDFVAVLANNSGSFGPPLMLPSNIDNAGIAALDLDDDGLVELVTSSERTNDLTVFRNVSLAPFRLSGGPDPTGAFCRYSWPAIDSATYSFVRGNLTVIWDDLTLPLLNATETPCAMTGSAATFYDDAMPLPVPVGSWPPLAFYLVRCEGANCPDNSFGADSLGLARYANDPSDPCP